MVEQISSFCPPTDEREETPLLISKNKKNENTKIAQWSDILLTLLYPSIRSLASGSFLACVGGHFSFIRRVRLHAIFNSPKYGYGIGYARVGPYYHIDNVH